MDFRTSSLCLIRLYNGVEECYYRFMKLLLTVIAILIVFLFAVTYYFFNTVFNRDKWQPLSPSKDSTYDDASEEGRLWLLANRKSEEVSITSFDGLKLKGLFISGSHTDRTIVCVHGYQMTGFSDFGMKTRFLCSVGYNILLLDNRAHGMSEGRYTGFSILDSKDIVCWCRYLVSDLKQTQIVLYGISMGGAAVLNAAGNSDLPEEVKGIVSDCAFADAFREIAHQIKRAYRLPAFPVVYLYDFWLRVFAKYSLRDMRPRDSIRNYQGSLLIIHGDKDRLVPVENAHEIYENASCSKDLLIVHEASHGRSYLVDKESYEERFKELLDRTDKVQS